MAIYTADDDLVSFAGTVATACDEAPPVTQAVFAVDDTDGTGALVVAVDEVGPAALATFDQVLARPRRYAALASRVRWSPTVAGRSSNAWLLVSVTPARPAFIVVRRLVEDRIWQHVPVTHAPWFAASTAAALRDALESGRPLQLGTALDPALFHTPASVLIPPESLDSRAD